MGIRKFLVVFPTLQSVGLLIVNDRYDFFPYGEFEWAGHSIYTDGRSTVVVGNVRLA